MIKMKIVSILCLVFLWILNGCSPNAPKAQSPQPKPLNIIVILDTSDRVSQKRQREKDIHIIEEIVKQFYNLVDPYIKKGGIIPPHRLTFVVPEQPRVPEPLNELKNKLTIEAPRRRSGNLAFQQKRNELINAISELYDHVQQHPQTGSDIWNWFRSQARSPLSRDHQNCITCISDGYLNFDSDIETNRPQGTYMRVGALRNDPEAVSKIKNGSEGLRPVGHFRDFNIKFLMLEIRLREEDGIRHFQDFDIIQAYWETWLNTMGITDTQFFEQLDPGGLKNIIGNFIQSE